MSIYANYVTFIWEGTRPQKCFPNYISAEYLALRMLHWVATLTVQTWLTWILASKFIYLPD